MEGQWLVRQWPAMAMEGRRLACHGQPLPVECQQLARQWLAHQSHAALSVTWWCRGRGGPPVHSETWWTFWLQRVDADGEAQVTLTWSRGMNKPDAAAGWKHTRVYRGRTHTNIQ